MYVFCDYKILNIFMFKKKKLNKIRADVKLYNCHDIINTMLLCYTFFVANLGEKTRVARCSIAAAM